MIFYLLVSQCIDIELNSTIYMARWQSGDATACKAVYSGSIPLRASILI